MYCSVSYLNSLRIRVFKIFPWLLL